MSKIEELQEIKKRDNKDIIYDGLQEALTLLKAKNEGVLDPVKEMAIKSANAVVDAAEKVMKDKTLSDMILELRTNGTVTLEEIAAKINEAKEGYDALVKAKDIKAKELEEMFGVEKELLDLAVVVNSNEVLKAKYDAELTALRQEKLDLLASKNEEAKEIIDDANAQAKAIKDEAVANQRKDQAEWNYTFGRQKIQDRDKFRDELAQDKKEWQAEIDETEKEINEREKAVSDREDAITSKEEEFAKYKKVSDELPKTIAIAVDKAVEKAVKDTEAKATTTAEYKDKEYQSEKKALNREIEMLKESGALKDKQIADLTKKLDDAYLQIKAVASDVANASRPVYNTGMATTK